MPLLGHADAQASRSFNLACIALFFESKFKPHKSASVAQSYGTLCHQKSSKISRDSRGVAAARTVRRQAQSKLAKMTTMMTGTTYLT